MEQTPSFMGHRKRLRQKLSDCGAGAFLPHELLELLLTYAIPRKDTKPLAWALLQRFGSLAAVLQAEEQQLCEVAGIGPQAARFLHLIRAVVKNYSLEQAKKAPVIQSPQQMFDYCKASLSGKKEECLELIFLSVRHTVLSTRIVATGVINQVLISPRQIIEYALKANASRIILAHNHPSGDATPSQEDIALTQAVIQAAALFDIRVEDHIIVGQHICYSLRAHGYM